MLIALILVLGLLAAVTLRRVPEGSVLVLQRADGHLRRLGPGVHVVLPLLERVRHRIHLTGHVTTLQAEELHGRLYWQVLEPERADGVIERADALLQQTAFEVINAQRGAEPALLKASLNQRLRDFGLLVTRVELAT